MDEVVDEQSLLAKKEVIDVRSSASTPLPRRPFVVACIPAFNEEASIARVVLLAERFVDRVCVCDDGSTDMTGIIAEALGAVIVIHETNLGYGAALQSLFEEAGKRDADVVVTLDADGRVDPSEIPRLLERLSVGDVDIVNGSRFLEAGGSEARGGEADAQATTGLVAQGGVKITDALSGFRAYNKRALEALNLAELGVSLRAEVLVMAGSLGLKVAEVPIRVSHVDESVEQTPVEQTPVVQESGVQLTTLKHLIMNRSLLFFGLPGLVATLAAVMFWVLTIQALSVTGVISFSTSIATMGATLIGLSLLTTGVIIWAQTRAVSEKL